MPAPEAIASPADPTAETLDRAWSGRSRRSFLRHLLHRPASLVAAIVLLIILLAVVFAPLVAPHDPADNNLALRLLPPFFQGGQGSYPLGTDGQGRDVLSRLMYGGQWSLFTAAVSTLLAATIGVTLGLVSGYLRGRADWLISLLVATELAFPFIVLALGVIAALGPSVRNLIIVLGVVGWPVYARVIRAQVLSLREREFVTAALVSGQRVPRILYRHLLPNVADSILVLATLQVATFILVEAFLSYLGLGIRPPLPSWGGMLNDGRQVMLTNPWVSTFPGLAIFAATLSINLVADAVRDFLDPHLLNE